MQRYVHSVGLLPTKNLYRVIPTWPDMLFIVQGPKQLAGFALVRALLRWLWSQQYALNFIAQVMCSLWQRYGHMEDFMLWLLQALTAETYKPGTTSLTCFRKEFFPTGCPPIIRPSFRNFSAFCKTTLLEPLRTDHSN